MKTWMWRALGTLLLAGAVAPAQAQTLTEDAAKDALAARAERALWWGDFDGLEQLYDEARQRPEGERNPWNGRPAVQSVRSGLAAVFKYRGLNGAYFRELEKLTEQWSRARPDSVLAQLVYARTLYAHAWHVRGSGYWQSVPAPAKKEFVRLIEKAEKHLTDRAELLKADTSTHVYLLLIGGSAGWSFAQMEAVAEDSLRRSPADEDVLYEDLLTQLLPKWGGSWPELQRYMEKIDARTGARRSHETYALLWSKVADEFNGSIFQDLRADWPRVKQGMESLAGKFRNPFYANRLAYLACAARALPAARAALAELGERADAAHWAGGGTAGRQNYEACLRWIGEAR